MESWAPLEVPARKVHKRWPQPKDPEMAASQNVRSNLSKVVDAFAAEKSGLSGSLIHNTRKSDRGKRLETDLLSRHNDMEADNYSIRQAPTGYNSMSSRRVMTERREDRNIDGLVGRSATARAGLGNTESQWKLLDPHVPSKIGESSAPILHKFSKTSGANLLKSVPQLTTNMGPSPHHLLNITEFKKSRTNHGYTKDSMSGAGQGISGTFNVENGIELPDQMLWAGRTQGSPVINTSVPSKFQQQYMPLLNMLLIKFYRQWKNPISIECFEANVP